MPLIAVPACTYKHWIIPATWQLHGGEASVNDRLQHGPRPGGGSIHLVLVGGGILMIGRRSNPWDKVGVAGVDNLGGVLAQPSTTRLCASTVMASTTLDPGAASRRPMESGYCTTCTSGKAPPAPKSSCCLGTTPVRLP
jgi:hypothetical protein